MSHIPIGGRRTRKLSPTTACEQYRGLRTRCGLRASGMPTHVHDDFLVSGTESRAVYGVAGCAGSWRTLARGLLGEAELGHVRLVVPEQILGIHRAVLPMADGRHGQVEIAAIRPDIRAVRQRRGTVKVPSMKPVTLVHSPDAILIGCSVMRVSGA